MTTTILQKDTTYTKLFIGGLPYHTTDNSLRDHFLQFGSIEEAVVITDRQTGKSRGYGFVTMAERSAAELICKDPNPMIDGRKANVNLAYIGAKPRLRTSDLIAATLPFTFKTTGGVGTEIPGLSTTGLPQYMYQTAPMGMAFLTQLPPGTPAISYHVTSMPSGSTPPSMTSPPTAGLTPPFVEYCALSPSSYGYQQVPVTTTISQSGASVPGFETVMYPSAVNSFSGFGFVSGSGSFSQQSSCGNGRDPVSQVQLSYQQFQQQVAPQFVSKPFNGFAPLGCAGQYHQ